MNLLPHPSTPGLTDRQTADPARGVAGVPAGVRRVGQVASGQHGQPVSVAGYPDPDRVSCGKNKTSL